MTKKSKSKNDETAEKANEVAGSDLQASNAENADNSEASEKAIDSEEEAQESAEELTTEELMLRANTLVGDVRDFLLDRLKHDKEGKPWAQMSEAEQREAIQAATSAAENTIRQVVQLVATKGFTTARAEIDSFKIKGRQIVITLKSVASEENVLALLSGSGNFVSLTFANDEAFDQDRAPCKPDPDQPGLSLEDGTGEEPDDEESEEGDQDEEARAAA